MAGARMMIDASAMLPWINALGLALLHFIWQGAIVGGLYYLVRMTLPAERSEARYATGLAALALLAVCPIVTFIMLLSAADSGSALPQMAAMTPLAIVDSDAMSVSDAIWPAGLPWLVSLWGLGVLLMAWRALHQWRGLERIARDLAEHNTELERRVAALAARLKVVQRVRVLVSAHIDTPSLIGWIRPVILLPSAVLIGMPRQQLELILSHELGHLRRRDHLVNLAQTVLEMLLFYHPVVHWISRDVRHEREVCCDRLVLRSSAGDPREYAHALAALEELRQAPAQLALAANGGMLLDRVRRIVGTPGPRMAPSHARNGLWLLVICALAAAAAMSLHLRDRGVDSMQSVPGIVSGIPDAVGMAGLVVRLSQVWPESISWNVDVVPTWTPAQPPTRIAPIAPAEGHSVAADAADTLAVTTPVAMEHRILQSLPPASADIAVPTPAQSMVAPAPPLAKMVVATPEPGSVAPATLHRDPVATHKVAPQYPDGVREGEDVRVQVAFAIDADGRVRNLRVVDGRSRPKFAQAAADALRTWRFDPASVAGAGKATFQQAFVFAGSRTNRSAVPDGCLLRTGSRICQ